MPFLDVPSVGESSSSGQSNSLPHLKLKSSDPGPAAVPRKGARLQQIEIEPKASFVIKSQLQTPHHLTGTPPLTKVFINATYANEVPEQHDAEKLRGIVNCVISDVRETADKAGKPSLVIDATLAPSLVQQCKLDKSYKQWLIQVILEKVEERMGVELSRNYTEPNIKCKGPLEPRKAVIPMDEETFERITAAKAKEKGLERIKLLDDDEAPTKATAKEVAGPTARTTIPPKSISQKLATTEPVAMKQEAMVRSPKHEFEIIPAQDKSSRDAFVMIIALPEESVSLDSDMTAINLQVTPDHLDFKSRFYSLSTPLPRDIDVDSVLKDGDAVEWSVEDKALRIRGLLEQR